MDCLVLNKHRERYDANYGEARVEHLVTDQIRIIYSKSKKMPIVASRDMYMLANRGIFEI